MVSRSSVEAELREMAYGICEGVWLKLLLKEMGLPLESSVKFLCDNQATISIAKNPVYHDRIKHVDIDRHFIREKIEDKSITVEYTLTSLQTADILTKALPRVIFDKFTSKLGMVDIYHPA